MWPYIRVTLKNVITGSFVIGIAIEAFRILSKYPKAYLFILFIVFSYAIGVVIRSFGFWKEQ